METVFYYRGWVYYFKKDHYNVPIDDRIASFRTEEEVEEFIDYYIDLGL